jgi:hypothetical protein
MSTHDVVVDAPDEVDGGAVPEVDAGVFDDDAEPDDPPPHAARTAASAPVPRSPSASRRETDVLIRAMLTADCKNFAVAVLPCADCRASSQ